MIKDGGFTSDTSGKEPPPAPAKQGDLRVTGLIPGDSLEEEW